MPIPQSFLSVCIDLYLYLDHSHSNDKYCFSVLKLFLLFYASILTIFEEFSSEQKILDSPVHTLWVNIKAEHVLCLELLLEITHYYLRFSPHLWRYDIINLIWMCCPYVTLWQRRYMCWTTWYVLVVGVIFSIVTSSNNELLAMLYTGKFLYVLSLKVKHVLRLICGSGSTWNPIWVLG